MLRHLKIIVWTLYIVLILFPTMFLVAAEEKIHFHTQSTLKELAKRNNVKGVIEIFPEFKQGPKDLNDFSHIIRIYHFRKSKGYPLLCRPFLNDVERGLRDKRTPSRPNPIGLSIVRLKEIVDNIISVSSLDILEETSLIDINRISLILTLKKQQKWDGSKKHSRRKRVLSYRIIALHMKS